MRPTMAALAYRSAILAIYGFLLAPCLVGVGVSFDPTDAFHFPPGGISLRWYRAFFESEPFTTAFFRVSLVVGLIVSLVATVIGSLGAIGLVRFVIRGRTAAEM